MLTALEGATQSKINSGAAVPWQWQHAAYEDVCRLSDNEVLSHLPRKVRKERAQDIPQTRYSGVKMPTYREGGHELVDVGDNIAAGTTTALANASSGDSLAPIMFKLRGYTT